MRRIFGCVPVCGAGRRMIVRVFVGGNGAAGLRGLRIVCGSVGGRTGRRRSAGPGYGGVGSRTVRQRLWGSPFRYPISERRGGFVGFRGASVRRKSAEGSVSVFAAGAGLADFPVGPCVCRGVSGKGNGVSASAGTPLS